MAITILPPPNDPPTAADDSDSTAFETLATINVLANDSDPDGSLVPGSVQITGQGTRGTATANPDGTITYTPNVGETGEDSFTYTVEDNDSLYGGAGLDAAIFADHTVTGFGTVTRTVQDRVGNGGRDSLSSVELLQFDDGVFDARNGQFTPGAFATPEVEQLVTSPGFSTNPEPSTPSVSLAQVETLVVQGEAV